VAHVHWEICPAFIMMEATQTPTQTAEGSPAIVAPSVTPTIYQTSIGKFRAGFEKETTDFRNYLHSLIRTDIVLIKYVDDPVLIDFDLLTQAPVILKVESSFKYDPNVALRHRETLYDKNRPFVRVISPKVETQIDRMHYLEVKCANFDNEFPYPFYLRPVKYSFLPTKKEGSFRPDRIPSCPRKCFRLLHSFLYYFHKQIKQQLFHRVFSNCDDMQITFDNLRKFIDSDIRGTWFADVLNDKFWMTVGNFMARYMCAEFSEVFLSTALFAPTIRFSNDQRIGMRLVRQSPKDPNYVGGSVGRYYAYRDLLMVLAFRVETAIGRAYINRESMRLYSYDVYLFRLKKFHLNFISGELDNSYLGNKLYVPASHKWKDATNSSYPPTPEEITYVAKMYEVDAVSNTDYKFFQAGMPFDPVEDLDANILPEYFFKRDKRTPEQPIPAKKKDAPNVVTVQNSKGEQLPLLDMFQDVYGGPNVVLAATPAIDLPRPNNIPQKPLRQKIEATKQKLASLPQDEAKPVNPEDDPVLLEQNIQIIELPVHYLVALAAFRIDRSEESFDPLARVNEFLDDPTIAEGQFFVSQHKRIWMGKAVNFGKFMADARPDSEFWSNYAYLRSDRDWIDAIRPYDLRGNPIVRDILKITSFGYTAEYQLDVVPKKYFEAVHFSSCYLIDYPNISLTSWNQSGTKSSMICKMLNMLMQTFPRDYKTLTHNSADMLLSAAAYGGAILDLRGNRNFNFFSIANSALVVHAVDMTYTVVSGVSPIFKSNVYFQTGEDGCLSKNVRGSFNGLSYVVPKTSAISLKKIFAMGGAASRPIVIFDQASGLSFVDQESRTLANLEYYYVPSTYSRSILRFMEDLSFDKWQTSVSVLFQICFAVGCMFNPYFLVPLSLNALYNTFTHFTVTKLKSWKLNFQNLISTLIVLALLVVCMLLYYNSGKKDKKKKTRSQALGSSSVDTFEGLELLSTFIRMIRTVSSDVTLSSESVKDLIATIDASYRFVKQSDRTLKSAEINQALVGDIKEQAWTAVSSMGQRAYDTIFESGLVREIKKSPAEVAFKALSVSIVIAATIVFARSVYNRVRKPVHNEGVRGNKHKDKEYAEDEQALHDAKEDNRVEVRREQMENDQPVTYYVSKEDPKIISARIATAEDEVKFSKSVYHALGERAILAYNKVTGAPKSNDVSIENVLGYKNPILRVGGANFTIDSSDYNKFVEFLNKSVERWGRNIFYVNEHGNHAFIPPGKLHTDKDNNHYSSPRNQAFPGYSRAFDVDMTTSESSAYVESLDSIQSDYDGTLVTKASIDSLFARAAQGTLNRQPFDPTLWRLPKWVQEKLQEMNAKHLVEQLKDRAQALLGGRTLDVLTVIKSLDLIYNPKYMQITNLAVLKFKDQVFYVTNAHAICDVKMLMPPIVPEDNFGNGFVQSYSTKYDVLRLNKEQDFALLQPHRKGLVQRPALPVCVDEKYNGIGYAVCKYPLRDGLNGTENYTYRVSVGMIFMQNGVLSHTCPTEDGWSACILLNVKLEVVGIHKSTDGSLNYGVPCRQIFLSYNESKERNQAKIFELPKNSYYENLAPQNKVQIDQMKVIDLSYCKVVPEFVPIFDQPLPEFIKEHVEKGHVYPVAFTKIKPSKKGKLKTSPFPHMSGPEPEYAVMTPDATAVQKDVAKYFYPRKYEPKKKYSQNADKLFNAFLANALHDTMQPACSFEEAVEEQNRQRAVGAVHNLYSVNKGDYIDHYLHELESFIWRVRMGQNPSALFQVFGKEELRELNKVLEGKARSVNCAPITVTVLQYMLFGNLLKRLARMPFTHKRNVNGSTPFYGGWDHWVKWITENFPNSQYFHDIDFPKWDSSIDPEFRRRVEGLVTTHMDWNEGDWNMYFWYLRNVVNLTIEVIPLDDQGNAIIVIKFRGMNSGELVTLLFNCLLNTYRHMYVTAALYDNACFHVVGVFPDPNGLTDYDLFQKISRDLALGDDFVFKYMFLSRFAMNDRKKLADLYQQFSGDLGFSPDSWADDTTPLKFAGISNVRREHYNHFIPNVPRTLVSINTSQRSMSITEYIQKLDSLAQASAALPELCKAIIEHRDKIANQLSALPTPELLTVLKGLHSFYECFFMHLPIVGGDM